MLKLLMSIALSSTLFGISVYAETFDIVDVKVINFLEKSVPSNANYTVDKVTILQKEELPQRKPWRAYLIRMDVLLTTPEQKRISMNDIVFTDGVLLSKDFIELEGAYSLKTTLFKSH